jgi:hypothetical protein
LLEAKRHLELSGIIALRRHCIAMVAESQLRIATRYMSSDIPALLGEIGLWVASGSGSTTAERKERVRETVDAMEAVLKRVNLLSPSSSTMSSQCAGGYGADTDIRSRN